MLTGEINLKSPVEISRLMPTPVLGHFEPAEEATRLFPFMKAAKTLTELTSRAISFELPDGSTYYLVPVSELHLIDDSVSVNLLRWRNQNAQIFDDRDVPTLQSTQEWIENAVIKNPNRILFFVQDEHSTFLGHLGLWIRDGWRFELDNVIKPLEVEIDHLFSAAVKAIASWCNEYLGQSQLYLRVLDSNSHAISFYKRLGFHEIGTIDRTRKTPILEKDIRLGSLESHDKAQKEPRWVLMWADVEAWESDDQTVLTAGPSIGPVEICLTSDAVRTGWNHHHSDYINAFSDTFAEYIGARYAIPTDSCTSALHLALWALGIGPGDEVIVPEITWVATANAVKYLGATPVFADVDPVTWCIDPNSVMRLITDKTKAVMPVHLYGYPAELEQLSRICERYSLYLVQDAAPGIGTMVGDESVAKYGQFSCFSFQGAKLLVSGEGGVLTTNDSELYERAFKIGDSGRKPGTFWIELLGKKMKMSNITASLALAQTESAERQIKRKRLIRSWYAEELNGIEGLTMQEESVGSRSICWMTSINVAPQLLQRDALQDQLRQKGIDTRPVFSPISRYVYWENPRSESLVASQIGDNAINLPSGVRLSERTVRRVAREVKTLLT